MSESGKPEKRTKKPRTWIYVVLAILGLATTLGLGAMAFATRNHFFYFVFYLVKSMLLFLTIAHFIVQTYTVHKYAPTEMAQVISSEEAQVSDISSEELDEAVENFRTESLSARPAV